MTIKSDQVADAFVTAPGTYLKAIDDQPSTSVNQTSGTFAAIDANLTKTFTVPYAGRYRLRLTGGFYGTGFSGFMAGRFRVNIDSGAQFVGGDTTVSNYGWDVALNVAGDTRVFAHDDVVELTAGSHQFSIEWAVISGGGSPQLNTSASQNWRVELDHLSGSGLGGAITTTEFLSAAQSIVATSLAPIPTTPLTLTFEGNTGEIVTLGFAAVWGSATGAVYAQLYLDGALIHGYQRTNAPSGAVSDSFPFTLTTSGTHTLELYANVSTGSALLFGAGNETVIHVTQYRGGQHEIRDADGNIITSTPRYWQLEGVVSQLQSDGGLLLTQPAAVAAPGARVELFHATPISPQTIVSGTFADIPGSALPEQQFVIPTTGTYDLLILLNLVSSQIANQLDNAEYQLVVDEGNFNGFLEQVVGSAVGIPEEWNVSTRNNGDGGGGATVEFKTVNSQITLEAGTHKVKFQAKTTAGAPRVSTSYNYKIVGTLVTGSGAGGEITVVKEAIGNLVISATQSPSQTWTSPAALQHTIEAAEGDHLEIHFSGYCSPTSAALVSVYLTVLDGADNPIGVSYSGADGMLVYQQMDNVDARLNSSFSVKTAALAAGSHTFKIAGAKHNSGQANWELRAARVSYTLHRGGLVPAYDKNGVLVIDKPNSEQYGEGLRVVNAGGRKVVSADFAAAGVDDDAATIVSLAAPFSPLATISWEDADNGGGDALTKVITGNVGEWVILSFSGHIIHPTAVHQSQMRFSIDGTTFIGDWGGDITNNGGGNASMSFSAVQPFQMTAQQHTVKVQFLSFSSTSTYLNTGLGQGLSIVRFRGGYTVPDNVPQLEYNSISVVNVVAAPGADSEGRVTLNDGIRRRATLPLTVNLAGGVALGGLDAGTELANTWYGIYAVPSGVAGEFGVVASTALPGVGPAGYTAWKLLEWVRNDGSSNIFPFYHVSADRMSYARRHTILTKTGDQLSPIDIPNFADWVPPTAVAAIMTLIADNGNMGVHIDGEANEYSAAASGEGGSADSVNQCVVPTPTSPKMVQYTTSQSPGFAYFTINGWLSGEARSTTQQAPARRSDEWNYLDLVQPTGAGAAEALYQFDKSGSDLLDRTANAHDLTASGAALYGRAGGIFGRYFNGIDIALEETAGAAGLRIAGALTVEVQCTINALVSSTLFTMMGLSAGSAENDNILYRILFDAALGRWRYQSESGSGVVETVSLDVGANIGVLQSFALTRDGSGNINVYHDGALISGPTATTSPTAGGAPAQKLYVGAYGTPLVSWFTGHVFALRITAEEFTASQIAEVYDRLRGRVI